MRSTMAEPDKQHNLLPWSRVKLEASREGTTNQIDPLFRRWFGKSCVVDSNGNPRIAYHGTRASFSTFKPKWRSPELGFHFGSIAQAAFFAGYCPDRRRGSVGVIMPVYLRIENPIRMFDIFERGRRSAENVARWLHRDGLLREKGREEILRARSAGEAGELAIRAIEVLGYDGIVYANEWEGGDSETNEDSYVVFRPEQIKSIFNRGTFSNSRESILE